MKSIASTIWRRGIWAGAPRRPGGSNRSATSSHCSSERAIAKLMPAKVRAGRVTLSDANPPIRTGEFGHRLSVGEEELLARAGHLSYEPGNPPVEAAILADRALDPEAKTLLIGLLGRLRGRKETRR
jgi:hypothetical protein